MFRTVGDQPTLWEAILPDAMAPTPRGAGSGGRLVGRSAVLHPVHAVLRSSGWVGRLTPMETYLRLMFLKFRYRLGFESLCREVSDSITWRQFCRIGIDQPVPHPTTLMKLTTRCGSAAVEALNEALLAKAAEAKLLRCTRIRADTTVVPANVAYPTYLGLLAKAVRRIAAAGRRIQAAGGAVRNEVAGPIQGRRQTRPRPEREAAGSPAAPPPRMPRWRWWPARMPSSPAWPNTAAREAERLLANARRALRAARNKAAELTAAGVRDAVAGRRRGRLVRAVNDLSNLLAATRRIAAQTRQRLSGTMPDGAARRVKSARSGCPADREGPARQAGRVRRQGPSRRQRRRRRLRP